MNDATIPATLAEAIFTEPGWLQIWVLLLVVANFGALLFVAGKENDAWKFRKEPVFIIVSFIIAAILMDWIYANYGYVRLLGMAHLVAWTPAYVYVLLRRKDIGTVTLYGKYISFYLVIAGLSLIIDAVDVIRYFIGDGELFLRWA